MRANTFVGQVIAVLSRSASAFELDSAEPQTFPGRLRALLSRRRRTDTASHAPPDTNRVTAIEKPGIETPVSAESPASRRTAPRWQRVAIARESSDFGAIRDLAHVLERRDPHVRLRVRAQPVLTELERSLDRGRRDLAVVRDLIRDLAFVRPLDRDRDRALDLDRALDRDRYFTLARYLTLARDLDLDLDLDLTRDLAGALGLDRDLARALARALTSDRDRARNLDRDLARALAHDLASALTFASDFDRDLALDLALALDLDLDLDRDRDRDRAPALVLADLDSVLADLDDVFADLDRVLHDFTTADLRGVDLTRVDLEGLRWSAATRWPTNWVAQVTLDSVEVAPNVFEVRGGNAYAPTPR